MVNPLRIKKDIIHELQYNLLLCYTGNIHVSANIIKDQVKNYEKALELEKAYHAYNGPKPDRKPKNGKEDKRHGR